MALGAKAGNIRGLVIRDGMRVAIIGAAAGLIAAFSLTRLMENLLFGVSPTDPITFVAVTGGLTTAALVASYIPAQRATRVDPLAALRYE
jgi:ABC-type lipoprotein release transport system permease subunit